MNTYSLSSCKENTQVLISIIIVLVLLELFVVLNSINLYLLL